MTHPRQSNGSFDMSVLIVEPNSKHARLLAESVRDCGWVSLITDTFKSAMQIMHKESLDLILLSLNGQRQQVMELLQASHAYEPSPPVIIMSDQACLEDATELMRMGAYDFWVKPVASNRLSMSIQLLNSKRQAGPASSAQPSQRQFLARDRDMLHVKILAEKVANTSATIFIQGESGTGKEMLARYIHQRSARAHKPFVAINCAAIPDGLLESELFGFEKGAFTGAIRTKEGKFELANGGTLLLDEVTEIPVHLQAKLLRVLQENELDRVGGRHPIPIDARIIATTNLDVQSAVQEGRFRKDLFYRLNVVPLRIPPLSQRPDDITLLTQHFLSKYNHIHNRNLKRVSAKSLDTLRKHNWPGNVRELENVIQRAVLLSSSDELTPECLIFDTDPELSSDGIQLMTIGEMEEILIGKALQAVDGNRTKAAEILGISVRTLRNKLQEYRQAL
jgi:DNA-binding NtrC family response regulator